MKHLHYFIKTILLALLCLLLPSTAFADDAKHTLKVVSKPEMAGTFNTNTATLAQGEVIHLFAYANSNFTFKEWTAEDGTVVATAQDFEYTMPDRDVTLTAVYDYNPANPTNPAANVWDARTGDVIIDEFAPGSLSRAIAEAIGQSKSSDVLMITVAGRMDNNDFNVTGNYSNCTLFDISRVTGITEVPSYAFDYTKLESVYLPASIEKIGYNAFYDCRQLQALTIYAMVPPVLENNVFQGVPDGLVVYVPAAAIAQYQDAEGWKDFTILPIQEDIRSLTVTLPQNAKAADYSQMWLELTNTKNGQKMHYVMTDRTAYTFANIIRHTSWNVVLRNQRGDVFGKIDNIEVKDEDVSVTFSNLSRPQSVSLSVLSPEGNDVTTQCQVTWLDATGAYFAQATSLSGMLAGTKLAYSVALPQELAMRCAIPVQTEYVVKETGNNVQCRLSALGQVVLTGKVKDTTTGMPLSGAAVSASQTFGGKYSKTVSAKTDASGKYTLTVNNVPTSLAVSASDYISQTLDANVLMDGASATVDVPEVALKPISGAVVALNLTYTKCPTTADDEDTFLDWYSDYNNVAYSIYNQTKQRAISQFNVQYPQIVLLEDVNEGDVLQLTATSKTGAFMPIVATATIDAEQRANAAFNIVELGKIKATFAKNANASVVATLYDAKGKLIQTFDYTNGITTINDLVDGQYSLVTMGSSRLFNTIFDLAQLPQTGLVRFNDYVQHNVEVKSGEVTPIDIDEVPTLDESKLYYTGDNTSFTVNKSSIVAGNYLTLTGHLDFKSAYATSVSNVNLVVDLPESCQFVENSVMVGNATSSYTLDGHRLTIPMARYTDRVRFCIIPTLGGDYAPSALAQFDLDGETITQPIGSATYTAKDLSITVPSTVAKTTIPVSGTAIGASAIDIYDGDVLIGQTSSLANGTWSTTCELYEPYNLSTHNIHAQVTTKAGLELQSENVECFYDKNAIHVSKVRMLYNGGNIVYDFQNTSVDTGYYVFVPSKPQFTFLIEFTENVPSKINDVVLYVKTSNNKWTPLNATFSESKGCWVASGDFTSSALPVNVSVDYNQETPQELDESFFAQPLNFLERSKEDVDQYMVEYKTLENEFEKAFDKDDEQSIELILNQLFECVIPDYTFDSSEKLTDDEIKNLEELSALMDTSVEGIIEQISSAVIYDTELLAQYMQNVRINQANGLSEGYLIDQGFEKIQNTEGYFYYVKIEDDCYEFVDFSSDVHLIIDDQAFGSSKQPHKVASREEWLNRIKELSEKIQSVVGYVTGFLDNVVDRLTEQNEATNKLLNDVKKRYSTRYMDGLSKSEIRQIEKDMQIYLGRIERNKGVINWLKKNVGQYMSGASKASKIAGKVFSFSALISDGFEAYQNISKLVTLYYSIDSPCENADMAAEVLERDVDKWIFYAGAYYELKLLSDIAELAGVSGGLGAIIPSGGTSVVAIGAAIVVLAANIAASIVFDKKYQKAYKEFCQRYKDLFLLCREKPCYGKTPCPPGSDEGNDDDDGGKHKSGHDDSKFGIDPSGFVYEGVFSNRLEGVTATAYYKEEVEDMYGDIHENIVKWDAAEYAQENPLFTDENGFYRWDVPQGMWQVKFEKEGYETTYSDWLPVPPPQLDVNIAMKQNVQPSVKVARAYPDAVEVEFDKYMQPELLTNDNIFVMAAGKRIDGTVAMLNEEVCYEGSSERYASKVRFNAAAPFAADEVTLFVSGRVKSYADIRMQDDFQQTFTVEPELQGIKVSKDVSIGYGEVTSLIVNAYPASAAAGKTLRMRSSSDMIVSLASESVTLDKNGKATVTVYGELPGAAGITFIVEGYDFQATTVVNVKFTDATADVTAPRASIASGSVVEKGTKVALSCTTAGTTIYYTTDGSCPCDEASRMEYTAPIVIDHSVTIRAIAVAADLTESDVAEFIYYVEDEAGINAVTLDETIKVYPLPVHDKLNITTGGEVIKSVTLVSTNGSVVARAAKPEMKVTLDVSTLAPGIYFINVATEDKNYSRKIMKVE